MFTFRSERLTWRISTIGAGIARSYVYLVTSYDKKDNLDFIADFTIFILWSEIEINIAMLVCCLPTMAPALGKLRDIISGHLPRSLRHNWTLLSSGKATAGTAPSLDDIPTNSMEMRSDVPSWLGGGRVVIAASRYDVEEQPADADRILARTEITTTSEFAPSK
jgi:hypothetical protein